MKSLAEITTYQQLFFDKRELYEKIKEIADSFEARVKGKRGAPQKREKFYLSVENAISGIYTYVPVLIKKNTSFFGQLKSHFILPISAASLF